MDVPLSRIDWALIEAFLAVAEEGSLSGAARRLGASQPTLGRQIRTLEAQLGTELFHRQPRGLAPTTAGAAMLGPSRRIRDAVAEIALTAAGREERLEGPVRITASEALSWFHLSTLIGRVRAAEPAIAIDLVPTDDSSNLLWREADIAVRMYRPTQLDLITRHIGEIELAAFASRDYVGRRGLPQGRAALLEHDFIGQDRLDLLIRSFAAAGVEVTREFFRTRCDSPVVTWALMRAGCGIGFGQAYAGRADPDLVEIDLGVPLPTLPVWLTAHDAIRRTPRVARVWDILADGLAEVCT